MTSRVRSAAVLSLVAAMSAMVGYRLARSGVGAPMPPAPQALGSSSAPRRVAPVPAVALPNFADIVEQANLAVVGVTALEGDSESWLGTARRFFSGQPRRFRRSSTGSGFLISADGYVFTNHHVVEDATRIMIDMADGTELQGRVVGVDPETDLALLKVESDVVLPTLPLGDSDATRVGEWVCAIGNPLIYEHTVTVGVVSAKGRRLTPNAPFESFLQTDAAINFGNSGGPLLNTRGEVVGINTAISSQGQNIGFAVPINMAKQILPQLRTEGRVARGFLGVSIDAISPRSRERLALESSDGVLVTEVEAGGAASRAGVEPGDVIIEVDDVRVESPATLVRMVAGRPPDTRVQLGIIRGGEHRVLVARLGERVIAEEVASVGDLSPLGAELVDMTERVRRRYGIATDVTGVVVVRVDPTGVAATSLTPGDVIIQVNGDEVSSLAELESALARLEPGEDALLHIVHHGGRRWVAIPMGGER